MKEFQKRMMDSGVINNTFNIERISEPLYKHKCSSCVFLGTYCNADLYACIYLNKVSTLIARFSNEDGNYASHEIGIQSKCFPDAVHRELRVA